MRARHAIVMSAALALHAACFNPPEIDQGLQCDPNGDVCPEGQYCADDGYCYWEDSEPCDLALPCPKPDDGTSNAICGQIYDIETHSELRDPDADGTVCMAGGDPVPCKLMVSLRDPVEWEASPDAVTNLDADVTVDDCGRFAALDIEHPASDYITIVVDDPDDEYVATARTIYLGPGEVEYSSFAVATARKTDDKWTSTAEDPFDGGTFSEVGAHLAYYQHQNEAAEDVIVRVRDQTRTGSDYYFADADPSRRTTIDVTADATGVNGAALIVDEGWAEYAGMGGLPDGCAWPKTMHLTLPGLISYGEYFSRLDDDSADCRSP